MFVIAFAFLALSQGASAAVTLQFDVTTFNNSPDGAADHFIQNNFNHMNVPTSDGGGHFLAQGSDAHRAEIAAAKNDLAVYYNALTNLYSANAVPANSAAALEAYCTFNFTSSGAEPSWVILNEISGSQWPNNATYSSWLTQTISILHNTYHHEVIIYAPFTTPAANSSDWMFLSSNAYIGVEDYLSARNRACPIHPAPTSPTPIRSVPTCLCLDA